jgi:hypothetical protein
VTQGSGLLDPVDVPAVYTFTDLSTRFRRWGSIRISGSQGEIMPGTWTVAGEAPDSLTHGGIAAAIKAQVKARDAII